MLPIVTTKAYIVAMLSDVLEHETMVHIKLMNVD
jgi:hypothetical protein